MRRFAIPAALGLLVLLGLAIGLRLSARLPRGPQPISWDREACAECHMHIGDPRFASQLQTREGDVLNFDDPGCLLRYESERRPAVHARFFHALSAERWLEASEVAFVRVAETPMGYNLGAVPTGTPGALTLADAQAACARSLDKAASEVAR